MPKGKFLKPTRRSAEATEAEYRALIAKTEYHLNIVDDWITNHAFQCSGCYEIVVCEGEFSSEFCDDCTAASAVTIIHLVGPSRAFPETIE